ncbi:hypothetical protein BH10CHL1_BH10CHL1_38550 [soil metagenome]
MLHVHNATRDVTLVVQGQVADSYFKRLKGLIGVRQLDAGDGLLIKPCKDIHTHFMSIPIDVLYVDANNRVVGIDPELKTWRFGRRRGKARFVIELPTGTVARTGSTIGDELVVTVS